MVAPRLVIEEAGLTQSFWMLPSTSKPPPGKHGVPIPRSQGRFLLVLVFFPDIDKPLAALLPEQSPCLYHAVARSLPDRDITAATACAEVVAHMRRYSFAYTSPSGMEPTTEVRGSTALVITWFHTGTGHSLRAGRLQIQASAKTAKCNILILPKDDASMPACVFLARGSRSAVVLWHATSIC